MSKFKKHVFLGICGCIAVLFGLVVQGAQPDTMRQIVWGLKKDFRIVIKIIGHMRVLPFWQQTGC